MSKSICLTPAALLGCVIFAFMLCAACAPQQKSSRTAEQVYRNITVLQGLPARELEPLMQKFNRALGVECTHCHVLNEWQEDSKPPFHVARNMFRMVQDLNDGPLQKTKGVSCWTCHGGQTRPARLPREILETTLEQWPEELACAEESTKLTMSVYNISLGVKCEHCHVRTDWSANTKPAHQMVEVMNSMFELFPKYMPPSARTQCWMCHQGSTAPAR